MNSHILKLRTLVDALPGALQFGEVRARELARDAPGIVFLAGNG